MALAFELLLVVGVEGQQRRHVKHELKLVEPRVHTVRARVVLCAETRWSERDSAFVPVYARVCLCMRVYDDVEPVRASELACACVCWRVYVREYPGICFEKCAKSSTQDAVCMCVCACVHACACACARKREYTYMRMYVHTPLMSKPPL